MPAARCVMILVIACWYVLAPAVPARASGFPLGAHVQVARMFDARAFERTITHSYHVTVKRIVAADVDRDGDIDVITASDGVVVFWVNDGQGVLSSSQASTRWSSIDGGAPAPVWDGGERDRDLASVLDDAPSMRRADAFVHAPQPPAARRCLAVEPALRVLEIFDPSAPRAPPA